MKLSFLIPLLALSIPAGAQTINAASCNASDVQTAFNAVVASTTTVNIPACTGGVGWTTAVTLNIPSGSTTLSVLGAGNLTTTGGGDQTVIVDNFASNSSLLLVTTNSTPSAFFRIAGITFKGGSGQVKFGGVISMNGSSANFRFDHSHLNTATYSPSNNSAGMRLNGAILGVADHDIFDALSGSVGNAIQQNQGSLYSDPAGLGDTAWHNATALGTSQFFYVESSTFNNGFANDCLNGGRFVYRFNTTSATAQSTFQTHPTGSSGGFRGCRAWEVYKNTVNVPTGFDLDSTLFISSGTGVIWGNTVTAGTSPGYERFISLHSMRRDNSTYPQNAPPNGWGYCGTSSGLPGAGSNWDQNLSSSTGHHCLDQPGMGQGDLLQGGFTSDGSGSNNKCDVTTGQCASSIFTGSWPNEAVEPIYEWLDTFLSGTIVAPNPPDAFVPNADYYLGTAGTGGTQITFNGTVGVGSGVLASRPSACTTGVAYWATDQGSWNTSGGGGQGVLYKCIATNTWAVYYTPYQYPHPLAGGGGGTVATPTFTPSTLSAPGKITVASSTPSSSCFYTVDGSTPTTSSTKTTHSLYVVQSQTVQAICSASGLTNSSVGSQGYSLPVGKTRFSLSTVSSSINPVPFPQDNRMCCGSNVAALEATRGTYTLTAFHNWITQSIANGSTTWFTVQGFPAWMTGLSGTESAPPTDLHVSAACQNVLTGTTTTDCSMKEFVTKIVEDRTGLSSQPPNPVNCPNLDYVEGINEFNTDSPSGSSTGWTGTYVDLAVLENDEATIIHNWCSNTIFIGGSASAIVGFHSNGENAHFDVALETLYADWAGISGASLPDAISFHAYPARGTVSPVPFPTTIVSNSDPSCPNSTPSVNCYIAVGSEGTQIKGSAVLQNAAIVPWAKFLPVYSSEGGFGTLSQLCSLTSGTTLCQSYVSEYVISLAMQKIQIAMLYAAFDSPCASGNWGCYWQTSSGVNSPWLQSFNQTNTWLSGHAITGSSWTSTAITGGNKWSLQLDSGAAEIDFCDAWLTSCSTTTTFTSYQDLSGVTHATGGTLPLTQSPVFVSNNSAPQSPTSVSVIVIGP